MHYCKAFVPSWATKFPPKRLARNWEPFHSGRTAKLAAVVGGTSDEGSSCRPAPIEPLCPGQRTPTNANVLVFVLGMDGSGAHSFHGLLTRGSIARFCVGIWVSHCCRQNGVVFHVPWVAGRQSTLLATMWCAVGGENFGLGIVAFNYLLAVAFSPEESPTCLNNPL
jgi:hypothetical protein